MKSNLLLKILTTGLVIISGLQAGANEACSLDSTSFNDLQLLNHEKENLLDLLKKKGYTISDAKTENNLTLDVVYDEDFSIHPDRFQLTSKIFIQILNKSTLYSDEHREKSIDEVKSIRTRKIHKTDLEISSPPFNDLEILRETIYSLSLESIDKLQTCVSF